MAKLTIACLSLLLLPLSAMSAPVSVTVSWTDATGADEYELGWTLNSNPEALIPGIPGQMHSLSLDMSASDQICARVRGINDPAGVNLAGEWSDPGCAVMPAVPGKPGTITIQITISP